MMTAAPGPQMVDASIVNETIPVLPGEKAETFEEDQLGI